MEVRVNGGAIFILLFSGSRHRLYCIRKAKMRFGPQADTAFNKRIVKNTNKNELKLIFNIYEPLFAK
jgi:hypothetical protein